MLNDICYIIVTAHRKPHENYGPYSKFEKAEEDLTKKGWKQLGGKYGRFWSLSVEDGRTAHIERIPCHPRKDLPRK